MAGIQHITLEFSKSGTAIERCYATDDHRDALRIVIVSGQNSAPLTGGRP